MERMPDAAGEPVERQLDGELRLLREAVLMVASGVSPHVTLAGLRHGERLASASAAMAAEAGVRVSAVRSASGRVGFSVERLQPPASQPTTLVTGRPAPAHP
jgi:hypothetical protein